jgi:hypothetical protein
VENSNEKNKKKCIFHIFTTHGKRQVFTAASICNNVSNEKHATPTVVMVVPRVRKVVRLSNAIQSFSQCDIRKHKLFIFGSRFIDSQ